MLSSDCSSVDVSFDVSMKRRGNIPAMNEINNRNFSQKYKVTGAVNETLRKFSQYSLKRKVMNGLSSSPSIAKTLVDTSTILS